MEYLKVYFITFLIVLPLILYLILRSPFKYPYYIITLDISGKRNPQIEDMIDTYLNQGNFSAIEEHYNSVQQWKDESQQKIEKSILKRLRLYQFKKSLDDDNMFHFMLIRSQTRYRQQNYVKSSYKVTVTVAQRSCSYPYLSDRYTKLASADFSHTLREYNSQNQRKLMTKDLRKQIMLRDNYTCQKCGKYMPDEVGLHIDHIIPIAKGGKTIPSNLQVLCSKCNGRKSDKLS